MCGAIKESLHKFLDAHELVDTNIVVKNITIKILVKTAVSHDLKIC